MNKKIPTLIIIGAIIAVGGIFVFSKNESSQPPENKQESQAILFYGEGCSHCARVEEFLEENQVEGKFSFDKKEVYYNKANAKELSEKARECGIPAASVGVPLLWDASGSNCIAGDVDIIDFFKQKISG